MKKYKQILAGLLAMNLAVYVMPTGMVQISASVQNQNNENTDTEEIETNTAESAGTTEEDFSESTQSAEADTTESAQSDAAEGDTTEDITFDDATDTSDDSSSDTDSDDSENLTGDQTNDSISDTTTELPGDAAEDATQATPTVSPSPEDTFSDGTQPDAAVIENNTAIQTTNETNSVLRPEGIIGYDKNSKTLTVESPEQLILLSYCDPSEVKKIKIKFSSSGDIDLTKIIAKGTNISAFYSIVKAETVSESQQTVEENTDSVIIDSQDEMSEGIEQESADANQSESDSQEIAETNELETTDETDATQGEESVQNETVIAGQEYTFQGICNANVPFQGEVSGSVNIIKLDNTFFGGLSSLAKISVKNNDSQTAMELTWCGDGTKPMIAGVYQFDSETDSSTDDITTDDSGNSSDNNHNFPVTIKGNTEATMGSLIGIVQEADGVTDQTLTIGKVANYNATVNAELNTGNAGLICGTLKGGTISLDGYTLPDKAYTVKSTANYNATNTAGEDTSSLSGNAGGLIGVMENNTILNIKSLITASEKSSVTSSKGNAGGMVGLMQKNAAIITEDEVPVTLSTMQVSAGVSAGGVAGAAENITITGGNWVINSPTAKGGSGNTSTAGGFIGYYKLSGTEEGKDQNYTIPECVSLTAPTVSTTGAKNGNTGGYFGHLELEGKWNCTFGNTENTENFESTHGDNTNQDEAYGAIAGKVTSSTVKSTVKVQNMTVTSTYKNKATYHGGLIGELGSEGDKNKAVYMETSGNVTITVKNPYADGDKIGFGGLVGCLAKSSILKAHGNVKISTGTTGSDPKIWEGGGIVGRAEEASTLELAGNTDLSGVNYVGNRSTVGWLVGLQIGALIYAKGDGNGNGWTYIRGLAKKQYYDNIKNIVNDIANYGQIIRLQAESSNSKLSGDLISITDDHSVKLKSLSLSGNDGITLNSADDFALLSIAWNSRGYFSSDSNITSTNWESLKSAPIKLTSDIDLSSSGITGLSRDNSSSDDDTYTGTFDGGNHRLSLAIGESFGFSNDNKQGDFGVEGCGKVYAMGTYHAALGLFAKTKATTIKNLVLDGNINFSNKMDTITAGGLAAFSVDNSTIDNVTAKETINADCACTDNSKKLSAGGLYGEASGGELKLQNNTNVSAEINLSNVNARGNYVYAGEVLGQITAESFRLAVNGLTIGDENSETAIITTDATNCAYIGGLVGIIKPITRDDSETNTIEEKRWIEIRSLAFNNFKIEADEVTESCGGLFGSIWSNVGVYFMGKSNEDEGEYKDKTKLIVKNSSVIAPKASGVGGLAYRSSGIWEIRDKGIDIQSMSIQSGSDVGMLVCRGEKGDDGTQTTIEGKAYNLGALYLNTTKNWKDSYKLAEDNSISITQNNAGVFDEFVAHTAAKKGEITYNGDNGIISLATAETTDGRIGVQEDSSACTTYQNRTAYGKSHQTNNCSRYYYDLDQCLTYLGDNLSIGTDGKIGTPQELMLWSVYRYASANIKHFFTCIKSDKPFTDITNLGYIGGESSSKPAQFDMRKYSYYPIDISDSITVQNADIKFYNKEIEEAETANKSTQSRTQHYTMHCGLFLRQLKRKQNTTVTVNNITFGGSIGKVNDSNSSGVLFADNVSGDADTQLYIATVSLKNITFDGLTVNNCGNAYAPLLINSIGSDSTLDVNGIKIKENSYTEGTAAASSLIGNVGSITGNQISLSFLDVVLPDKKVDDNSTGIFSHATLLESFTHDGTSSVATYNFYMGDEWKDGKYTHGVTYGREITETKEYKEQQQLWYYDEENYGQNSNRVHTNENDLISFSSASYLPYVCTGFDAANKTHEIKVNQRVADITHGCGTYSHPYKITSEREMTILSEYMATGTAQSDWRVTITGTQSKYHIGDSKYSSTEDKTYQFDGTDWVQVEKKTIDNKETWESVIDTTTNEKITLNKDFMLQYLLNAYYDLQGTDTGDGKQLKLNNFSGFGISTRPFRGVITSTNGTTVVLSGPSTGNGLIAYSYGSVVKNLTVSYITSDGNGKTLSYNGQNTSGYYPDVCFGGVIGCVIGGDNIIDNVTVQMDDDWLSLGGDKPHLIQVGGYVGSVSGGGVIFRNIIDKSGLTDEKVKDVTGIASDDTYTHMYVNPYVGRVLDGFVFYEITDQDNKKKYAAELKNTDKNYLINTLNTSDTDSVAVTDDDTVTVKNAQGLLILSAVINSGAASSGQNNAYSSEENATYSTSDNTIYGFAGKYGKVRNASYNSIGKSMSDDENETKVASADDYVNPGSDSLPYLIKNYCSGAAKVFNICNDGAKIKLLDKVDYDMSGYGSSYQGISARYISSAVLQGNGARAEGVVPELVSFDGSDKTVTLDTQVKEYEDDDFHAASVGGIFNLLRVGVNKGVISNLVISGKKDQESDSPYSGVSLEYYDNTGEVVTNSENTVDVGAFTGAVSGLSATGSQTTGSAKFSSVTLQNLTIKGSQNSGGLLGSSQKTEILENNETGKAVLFKSPNNEFSVRLEIENTKYDNISVTAPQSAGGFVGYLEGDVASSIDVTGNSEMTIGNSSKIGNTDNTTVYSGGALGYVKSEIKINAGDNRQNAVLENVTVTGQDYAGGFIGQIDEKPYNINQAVFKGSGEQTAGISVKTVKEYAGGIIGLASGANSCTIQKSQVIQTKITVQEEKGQDVVVGGDGGIVGKTSDALVLISGCSVSNTSITGGKTGGVIGYNAVTTTIKNCTVQGSDKKYEITGSETAGGIIGVCSASNAKIQMEQCEVNNMKMTSSNWGCGGLLGDVDWNNKLDTLYLFDCSVKNSEVSGIDNSDNPTAGGIAGDVRGNLVASNLLLKDTTIHCKLKNKVGMVLGLTDDRTGNISVAGLSIQNTKEYYGADETNTVTQLYGVLRDDATIKNAIEGKSYFAFADYSGKASENKNLLDDTKAIAPYVVTSPKSALSLYATNSDPTEKSLYGDGAYWTSDNKVMAQEIWTNRTTEKDGHYAYNNTSVEEFEFKSAISTYNANQTNKVADDKNFPVVQISAGNVDIVTDYLNIVTNGGFSAANERNTSKKNAHVTAKAEVYTCENGNFVKAGSDVKPALDVKTDNTGKITFTTTTDYDNDKNRFTLLTVTFTEKDTDGEAHNYKVFVPVLVRRMLEIDFTATLTYGTDFKKSDYAERKTHVLESFGSSITGYLTYTYNSAENKYTDYGWQSYINAGGNLMEMKKSILFTHGTTLPKGTQLSLVDCRDKKVYYYTATGKTDTSTGAEKVGSGGVEIPLSCFEDSDGNAYQEPSISELIDAKASTTGDNKIFIKVDKNGKPVNSEETESKSYPAPTIKIKNENSNQYEYYRLAESALSESGNYSITVDEESLKNSKTDTSTVTENYYLVITVPKNKETEKIELNGAVMTTVDSKIPNQIHYRNISGVVGKDGEDVHNNTASTYLLSNGYNQSLVENNITDVNKKISMSDSTLKVDVKDTITFPNSQVYNNNDQLYLRFVGGLQKTIGSSTTGTAETVASSAEQFPSETSGRAYFYVYTEDSAGKKYYIYTNGTWSSVGNDEQSAVDYTWTSTGGNMELPLSTDGTVKNAISLHGLRNLLKNASDGTGSSTFYVEVKMDATIPGTGLDVIPETELSGGSPKDYVKLTYYSQLSTENQSLTYSSNRANVQQTATAYYREEPSGISLSYDADKIDQLGINLLDLQSAYLDADEQNTYIDTTATYDLSAMKNLKETLKNSYGIKFTLSLMPKRTKEAEVAKNSDITWKEDYGDMLKDAAKYLDVELRSQNSGELKYDNNGTWFWTVPQASYYDTTADQITTSSVFDGGKLLQAIRLKVNVTNVETSNHFYSNYKVVLTADIMKNETEVISNTHKDSNIIYTLAKIKPEFVDSNGVN